MDIELFVLQVLAILTAAGILKYVGPGIERGKLLLTVTRSAVLAQLFIAWVMVRKCACWYMAQSRRCKIYLIVATAGVASHAYFSTWALTTGGGLDQSHLAAGAVLVLLYTWTTSMFVWQWVKDAWGKIRPRLP